MIRRSLALVALLVVAGCGAGPNPRPTPHIGALEAAKLESLANTIATTASTDPCAAHAAAMSLQTEAAAAVNSGRIPLRLRSQLLAGAAAVLRATPACAPVAPPPAPITVHPHPHQEKPKPPKHDHGHGHGEGD